MRAAITSENTVRNGASYNASSAKIGHYSASCGTCNLRGSCLSGGVDEWDTNLLHDMSYARRRIKRGENLYRAGVAFESLYVVRSGFFKSFTITEDGDEQVTGFQMAGEPIGFDGIESDFYTLNVSALEDSIVCVIPFAQLERMASRSPGVQHQLLRLMSREIVHDQSMRMRLATMDAESRVAAFLLDLSRRFATRGYSGTEFVLRMTREEIGSHLGLKLETVSRVFSKLQQSRLIGVEHKHVCLRDIPALNALIGVADPKRAAHTPFALAG